MGKSAQRKTNERNIKTSQRVQGASRTNLNRQGENLTNTFEGLQAQQQQGQGYGAQQAQAATLGPAAQAQIGNLGSAQGYQTTQAQAQGTNVDLTNPFANLQVGTAATDRKAAETDAALAATLEGNSITGAGGATALAQAAAGSKADIGADIQQQELQNQQLAASGEQSRQSAQLGQQQFNVGAQNQASQFNASSANQASQFEAQSQNQFALEKFGAENQLSQFNASAQNSFAQARFGAANTFNLANAQSQNESARFGAQAQNQANAANTSASNQFALQEASGAQQAQDRQYNHAANRYAQDANQAQAAKQAESDRKASNKAFWGGIAGGVLGVASSAVGGGKG